MLIVGFDPSKSTGWALIDTTVHIARAKCGVLELPEKADHYYTGDQLSAKVRELLLDIKQSYGQLPDFAVLEGQKKSTFGNKGFDGIVYPWISSTAIVCMLSGFAVPYGTLSDSQWREFYGPSFEPPQKPVMKDGIQERDKHGKLRFSNDWKAAAVNECEAAGVVIPSKKTIAHNACEAVMIARSWRHKAMEFHAGRYMKPWIDLCLKPDSWSRLDARQGVAA